MSGKHTPGPWLIYGDLIYALDETGTVNRFSARVDGGYVRRDKRRPGDDERTSQFELVANLLAMRAVPEMLEALNAFPSECDYPDADSFRTAAVEWFEAIARPAMAKAEGQS